MSRKPNHRGGFTLVELLVVIAIIAILAVLSFAFTRGAMNKARKVQTLAQLNDLKTGMQLLIGEYQRVLTPETKNGYDTMYGDPGGTYANHYVVAMLAGEKYNGESGDSFPMPGGTFRIKDVNPKGESYVRFPLAPNKRNGVGPDGRLYDAWGSEIMMSINGYRDTSDPTAELVDREPANGRNDRYLNTWGYAEYKEDEDNDYRYFSDAPYAFWSYGADKKKGKEAENYSDRVPYTGSDDVLSWR